MTTNRTMAGRTASTAAGPHRWAGPPGLWLLGLALGASIQAGCASDGCSNCNLGSKFSQGVQSVGSSFKSLGSVFHHKKGCGGGGSDCGCGGGAGGEEGVVIDSGIPVVPGGMAIPAPGTIVTPPAIESAPTQLDPIPASSNGGSGASKASTNRPTPSGNTRSSYTTMLPKSGAGPRRGSEVAQALHSSPEAAGRPSGASGSADLFENIPPVDLPKEVTRRAVDSTPAPKAANPPASTTPPASDTAAPTAAEKISAAEGATLSLPPIEAGVAHQAPGIHRYASIAPSVAGGSAPSIEGLDWLKEKGHRTLVDLRKSSEVEPDFVDAVNDRGMVYISLPIVSNRLDPNRLARFDDLVSQSENRPLYFCDVDGTRAGLAWYIHLRTVKHEDSQAAAGKAEEIGLTPAEVKIAESFLAAQKPRAKVSVARVALASPPPATPIEPMPEPPIALAPAVSALPTSPQPEKETLAPEAPPKPADEATPPMLPGEGRPQAARGPLPDYREPGSWRPAAALVLTSLGVPLAFWSRSIFTESRQVRRRASLTGPGRRSIIAPAGSDA